MQEVRECIVTKSCAETGQRKGKFRSPLMFSFATEERHIHW